MSLGQAMVQQTTEEAIYITPAYLFNAAQRKYGKGIQVLGYDEDGLAQFWSTIEAKSAYFNDEERPKEVNKLIIDITAKEHCNTGGLNDVVEVETSQKETSRVTNSYTLAIGKESGWEFGGGLSVDASFFNTAAACFGIEGKRNKNKWESQAQSGERERALAKSYGVKATEITVPPRTKLAMRITTYAVTYKVKVKVVISAPVTSYISFYYTRSDERFRIPCCGGRTNQRRSFGYVTAFEMFRNQKDFQDLGHCIQFKVDSELGYVGETVELHKEMTELPPTL